MLCLPAKFFALSRKVDELGRSRGGGAGAGPEDPPACSVTVILSSHAASSLSLFSANTFIIAMMPWPPFTFTIMARASLWVTTIFHVSSRVFLMVVMILGAAWSAVRFDSIER